MHTLDQQYRELKESQRNALAPPPLEKFNIEVKSDGETVQVQEVEDTNTYAVWYLMVPILIIAIFVWVLIFRWAGALIVKAKEWIW